jgi:oligosaccharide repeat unit polymerase
LGKVTILKYSMYFLTAIALFISVATFMAISSLFGNPFEEGNGEAIKNARVAFGSSYAEGASLLLKISGLMKATIFFSLFISISLSIYSKTRPPFVLLVLLLIASVLYDASVGGRTLLFDYLILSLLGLLLHKRLVNQKVKSNNNITGKFALLAVCVIGIGGAFLITDATRSATDSTLFGYEVPYTIYQLALYYASPIVIFSQVIDEPHPTTYGLSSFGGILGILNYMRITFENLWIYDIWTEWELSNPYFNSDSYYSRGNSYSWLRYMYSDWGYLGCVIIPSMVVHLGMKSIYLCKRASRESIILISYYFIAAFIIVKSPTMMIARNEEIFMILIAVFLSSLFLRLKFTFKAPSIN